MCSFTIRTTAAYDDLTRLPDRMPAILEAADWPLWLGEAEGDHLGLLRPAESGVLRLWTVTQGCQQRAEQWGRAAGPHR